MRRNRTRILSTLAAAALLGGLTAAPATAAPAPTAVSSSVSAGYKWVKVPTTPVFYQGARKAYGPTYRLAASTCRHLFGGWPMGALERDWSGRYYVVCVR